MFCLNSGSNNKLIKPQSKYTKCLGYLKRPKKSYQKKIWLQQYLWEFCAQTNIEDSNPSDTD